MGVLFVWTTLDTEDGKARVFYMYKQGPNYIIKYLGTNKLKHIIPVDEIHGYYQPIPNQKRYAKGLGKTLFT